MMPDDIRDLLGRYATGSLTPDERKRLFDAALDDQELFEELAREDEMKQLFAGPGVRDRLIRALEPPKRRVPWVLALVPVAALSALLLVVLMRPAPKAQQVAVMTIPAPPAITTPQPTAVSEPEPVREKRKGLERPPERAKEEYAKAENIVKKDAESRALDQKEPVPKEPALKDAAPRAADQVAAAPPAAPAPPVRATTRTVEVQAQPSQVQVQGLAAAQQNAPGGPKQNAVQTARALGGTRGVSGKIASVEPGFGLNYSVETAGHLIIIPLADGYLSVKSTNGDVIFAPQRIAAGTVNDITLPGGVRSLSIQFSAGPSPGPISPVVRTGPEGTLQAPAGGPNAMAVELKLNP